MLVTTWIEFGISDYVSRNVSEPCQASLRTVVVVSLSDVVKPEIRMEEMAESTLGAIRGKRGRRA